MATAPKKTSAAAPAQAVVEGVANEIAETPSAPASVVVPTPMAPSETPKALQAPAAALTELQGNLRSVVEKGLAETRAAYAKAKVAADETASALESSYTAAKAGVAAINAKALDALRANVDANFEFVKSALNVTNLADYVALQGEFARKQLDALASQTKEINALAQKVAVQTTEPIKERVAKTFKIAV